MIAITITKLDITYDKSHVQLSYPKFMYILKENQKQNYYNIKTGIHRK